MQMTSQEAAMVEQREAENVHYRKLRGIEAELSALVSQSPSRFELDGLAAAHDVQTGGDLKAELAAIMASVPRLQKHHGNNVASFTYRLLSDSVYGRQWTF